MNGRIVANVLMGISTPAFHEKKYGGEIYFGEYKGIEYQQVIERAKKAC